MAADLADASVHRFFQAALAATGLDFVLIAFELERIDRCYVGVDFGECTVVDEEVDILLMADGIVASALRADPMPASQGHLVVGVATLFALDPDALGNFALY